MTPRDELADVLSRAAYAAKQRGEPVSTAQAEAALAWMDQQHAKVVRHPGSAPVLSLPCGSARFGDEVRIAGGRPRSGNADPSMWHGGWARLVGFDPGGGTVAVHPMGFKVLHYPVGMVTDVRTKGAVR